MTFIPHIFYIASIFDFLDIGQSKIGELFITGAFKVFDTALNQVFVFLGRNPAPIEGGSAYAGTWKLVSSLYDSFAVIGYTLVVIFFLYGFLRDSVDIRHELQFESIIKLFIRFTLTINIMNVFITYVPKFCGWAIALLGFEESEKFNLVNGDLAKSLSDEYGALIMYIGVLIWIICIACSVILIFTCFGRFINFYLLIPFGSIALSTLAGGGQLSQTGFSYIKNLLVYTFEIVAIGIVLAIAGSFLNASSIFDKNSAGVWLLVEVMVKMIAITAGVKGADTTLRRAFNI